MIPNLRALLQRLDVNRILIIGLGVILSHSLVLWQVRVGQNNLAATIPPIVLRIAPLPSNTQTSVLPHSAPARALNAKPVQPRLTKEPPKPTIESPVSLLEANPVTSSPSRLEMQSVRAAGDISPPAPNGTSPTLPEKFTGPSVQLPSSNADYLNNPAPIYPSISKRLGEQGQVVIRVLIGKDGSAHQGEVYKSSGYERLDQAALRAVTGWRFVPGQRSGVPQDMWFNVPVSFTLK